MSKYDDYQKKYADVKGSFNLQSTAAWDILLSFQKEAGIDGNLFEIGVQYGKSALLSAMHAREKEEAVYCDLYLRDSAVELLTRERSKKNTFLKISSTSLEPTRDLPKGDQKYRWVHIDGNHSGTVFMNDLKIADRILSDDGVLVIDDFFSEQYPQITEAFFNYVNNNRFSLHLFLCGHNKGYVTRPISARKYLLHIKNHFYEELCKRGQKNTRIFKTTSPDDYNCFGFAPAYSGKIGYHGPDWDDTLIEI